MANSVYFSTKVCIISVSLKGGFMKKIKFLLVALMLLPVSLVLVACGNTGDNNGCNCDCSATQNCENAEIKSLLKEIKNILGAPDVISDENSPIPNGVYFNTDTGFSSNIVIVVQDGNMFFYNPNANANWLLSYTRFVAFSPEALDMSFIRILPLNEQFKIEMFHNTDTSKTYTEVNRIHFFPETQSHSCRITVIFECGYGISFDKGE